MNTALNEKLRDCDIELQKINEWIDSNKFHTNVKYLVSYSVMKACGTIEIVFKYMIYLFLSNSAEDATKTYLEKQIIDSSCNPSFGNIKRMIEQFDGVKAQKFEDDLKLTGYKNGLSSLVNLRNNIGHGRDITASITNVIEYYEAGKNVLLLLESVLSNSE